MAYSLFSGVEVGGHYLAVVASLAVGSGLSVGMVPLTSCALLKGFLGRPCQSCDYSVFDRVVVMVAQRNEGSKRRDVSVVCGFVVNLRIDDSVVLCRCGIF